ncbi:MAG: GNAT family N-acetyltransferase, partial [Sphingomonas sp.]|nr:GNAT family N-acetyltransferase [Sphingomonas sp.]
MTDITARMVDGVGGIAAADWDACSGADNPFLSHAFLSILEQSGSVAPRAGWQSIPIVIDGEDGRPAAIAPAYAKSHSQGEYVFDHAWADAWHRAGGQYYPKLQVAVPFTPVPGPRLLLRDAALAPALIGAVEAVTVQQGLSSAHATFVAPEQLPLFEAAGWLIRAGTQFHWRNDGYASFDDFLGALASRKRKAIRKERAQAIEGLTIRHVTGAALTEADWDAFWVFYQDTGARKWGQPYLKRAFFSLLGAAMGDRVLLILAERDGRPIAGALNL